MTSSDSPGSEREARSATALDLARIALPVVVLFAFALAWRFSPLGDSPEAVRELLLRLRDLPAAPAVVVAAFVVGGLVVAPVSLLILATVIVFGALWGSLYALAGSLASASVVYGVGHLLGRGPLDRLLGERVETVGDRLGRHGLLTVAVVRNIPVAPYSVVNLVAGASPIRFGDYFWGTALGLLPGLVGLALVGDNLERLLTRPEQVSVLGLAGLVLALGVIAFLGGRWLRRRWSD
jgi:uncharacterized membrane protein YdjX (TVP38/TMEM64 family)